MLLYIILSKKWDQDPQKNGFMLNDLALVTESRALESKGLRVNVKKTKMRIISEKARKFRKFPGFLVLGVSGMGCREFRGRLKRNDEFKCRTWDSQKTDTVEKSADIELNGCGEAAV